MLAIYDSILKSWFKRNSRRRDSQKNLVTLKVNKGIPEAYSELCQTSDALAQHMKNLRKKDACNSSNARGKLNVGHSL